MTAKEQLLREIEQAPEALIEAILHLLQSVKAQSSEHGSNQDSIQEADSTQVIASPLEADNSLQNLFNEFEQFAQSIPPEELVNLHTDSAQQHDQYLYGNPQTSA
ncbi:hypothetical protein [Calothrix sp. PCC 7507]|uniref:hypothetical protein n=1 Tax=Calothrix sp. PCC 7507 TaxID=99598 RepID=UPI00029ED231|nr:hypothetical protein [Calothrix sp. PCC 7507]AFY30603.1 hypothetical protein Cal7507_0097 [Calothrix sp. PCC 7507]